MTSQQQSDNIYYNIQLTNNDYSGPTYIAYYSEQKDQPLLDRPSDYYLAINRFSIPTTLIPLFMFETQVNPLSPTDVNYGIYSITLSYTYLGTVYDAQIHLIYVPVDIAIQPPSQVSPQVRSPYYFVYSYRDVLRFYNTAFQTAYTNLNTLVTTAGGTLPLGSQPPFFLYNSSTQLFSLITTYDYTQPNPISVYFNTATLQLFESISGTFLTRSSPVGKNFNVRCYYTRDNGFSENGVLMTNPPQYVQMVSEYVNMRLWSPVQNIVFTTTSIPISAEGQPNLVNFSGETSSVSNYRSILTDFQPIVQVAGSERTQQQYQANGPLRLVDLKGEDPLRSVDLSVYWSDRNNNLYPIELTFSESLSVKLLFIRKTVYSTIKYPNFDRIIK